MKKKEFDTLDDEGKLAHINSIEVANIRAEKAAEEAEAATATAVSEKEEADRAVIDMSGKLSESEKIVKESIAEASAKGVYVTHDDKRYRVLAGKIPVHNDLQEDVGTDVLPRLELKLHKNLIAHLVETQSGILSHQSIEEE